MKEDKSKLIEVFTGSLWEAELLNTYLADNGIRAVVRGGTVVNLVLPSTNVDVSVLVNDCDMVAAKKMVQIYMENKDKE